MSELKYFTNNSPLNLESGASLSRFQIAYQTFGKLNTDKSNVIWVLHALTANSDPMDWWSGIVGDDKVISPKTHFIICANMLGSHYGSTNALSINPESGEKYYHDFPILTNRDIAKSFDLLRIHLGIENIDTLIGSSLGGQQAQEWAILAPKNIKKLILIATNAIHSPYGIAFNESQRLAIEADQTWKNKDDAAGQQGLRAARSIALLSYRTAQGYDLTQKEDTDKLDNYRASSYQRYQGDKLVKRFNAFSYWTLSKAMDNHNVGRNRGGLKSALQSIHASTTIIGIDSDVLFPVNEQKFLAEAIPNASYYQISSALGHDGFLIENDSVSKILSEVIH